MTHEWKQKWRDVWLLPTVIEVIVACLACIIHEGTASGCWEREDAGGSVILVAWPCC
jgi:hypothetical protein